MNPFARFLCTVALGAGLTLAVTPARIAVCAPPNTTHPDLPGLKAPASSFAPHAASRNRAYGMPIQAQILRRHNVHRRHAVPRTHPPQP